MLRVQVHTYIYRHILNQSLSEVQTEATGGDNKAELTATTWNLINK